MAGETDRSVKVVVGTVLRIHYSLLTLSVSITMAQKDCVVTSWMRDCGGGAAPTPTKCLWSGLYGVLKFTMNRSVGCEGEGRAHL